MSSPTAAEMRQPQDGASEALSAVKVLPAVSLHGQYSAVTAQLNEPEDARLTGTTRSLGRRLLGLNAMAKPVQALRQKLLPQRATVLAERSQIA